MWEIKNERGELIKGQENMEEEAQRYFENVYKDVGNHSIVNKFEVIREYPSYFSVEEGPFVARPVALDEVRKVFEGFEKPKSPCPYGWIVEFFLEFFYVMGEDLLVVVEESRTKGVDYGALNVNFIIVIPKKDKP